MKDNGTEVSTPKISIIIPAYNVASYVGDALASVESQICRDYEVIVVNDGSPDDLEKALAPWMDRIVYVRQENRGLSGARNTGMRIARGEYIALLDADDVWMPNYLGEMAAMIEGPEQPDIVYCNAVLFGMPEWEGRLYQDIYPSTGTVTVEKLLTRECSVFISAMFRRETLERTGMFDESIRGGGEDFDLWIRAAHAGLRFAYTNQPLARYRKRAGSLSSNEEKMAESVLYICNKFLATNDLAPEIADRTRQLKKQYEALLDRALAKQKIESGEFQKAAQHLSKANNHFRSVKLTIIGIALRVAPRIIARLMRQRNGQTGFTPDPRDVRPGLKS